MPKTPRPWPTPPFSSFRDAAYFCHNCGTEQDTLDVGTWLSEQETTKYGRNKLVLCKLCFESLSKQIVKTTGFSGFQYTIWLIKLRNFLFGKRKRK